MATLPPGLQTMVQELHDREAIRDCVARYCRGVDRFDRELILSAFHPDATDEHGKFVGNPREFVAWELEQHSKAHLSHQHCMLQTQPDMNDLSSFTSTLSLLSETMRAFMNGGPAASRDRNDPSYQRPLRVDATRARTYRQMAGKP